jgi:hypothetical protein
MRVSSVIRGDCILSTVSFCMSPRSNTSKSTLHPAVQTPPGLSLKTGSATQRYTGQRTAARQTLYAAAGLCCIVAASGCYERVVSSHGIGTSDANVESSYRSNTALDRAFDRAVNKEPAPSGRAQRYVDPGSAEPGSKR